MDDLFKRDEIKRHGVVLQNAFLRGKDDKCE
jgi:hypothetical protein